MRPAVLDHSTTEDDEEIKLDQDSVFSTPKCAKGGKMAELKLLISKRATVKGKLTRIQSAIVAAQENATAISTAQLRVYSKNVEKYYSEFNEVHDIVMQTVHDNQRDAQEVKLIEFEELYNEVQVVIETLLDANRERSILPAGGQHNGQQQVVIHQQSLRAPLPTFDGRYENWPRFKSMFLDLMRNSPDSDAIKLFHLDKSLVGSAAGIIDAKTIQDNNYQQAWQILEQRYENKRLIIDVHIQGIMQLKKMAKKSSKELRSLIDECSRHVENLKFHDQLLQGVSELMVIHILSAALDQETRELWEATIEHGVLPNYVDTMDFLRKRCLILKRCESAVSALPSLKQASSKVAPSSKASKISAVVATSSEIVCELCGGGHPNFKCSAFIKMNNEQRVAKVKDAKVCFNCLRKGHMVRACPSQRTCVKCNQKHHIMLHLDQVEGCVSSNEKSKDKASDHREVAGKADPESPENEKVSVTTSCVGDGFLRSSNQVLLQTAMVDVVDVHGRSHACRALLDSGSQAHILSKAMAQVLGLPTLKCNITVVGANSMKTQLKRGLNLNFMSRYSDFQDSITCLISDKPTSIVPSVAIDASSWNIPPELQLADPLFYKPSEIDLVLASSYVWDLLRTKRVLLDNRTASLRETDLGWIITGTYEPYHQASQTVLIANVAVQDTLLDRLDRFCSIEEVEEPQSSNTEEQEVEQYFVETYRRDEFGRFIVKMPFRETVSELESNRNLALKRFLALERKLLRNPELRNQYIEFMGEYERLGHCKEITEEDDTRGMLRYYLPHHAVFKLTSSSTKVRVVFDASAKESKYSLNDVMKTGPSVQNDIFTVNLRFRQHVFGFSGDVTKMFRQILIDHSQTRFLRIFWREDSAKPLRVLELVTRPYSA
ncbi:uncharacterized protein LOC131429399 [Malaya genurostris]|uniref:uncharacterized protein LOC131429399 n=1 Tax=Malaya genurostris TaxID=325434 RepID=UPI0026F3BA40|nr:uncharacterized protein LOC131429399 [Malaya genurostris]